MFAACPDLLASLEPRNSPAFDRRPSPVASHLPLTRRSSRHTGTAHVEAKPTSHRPVGSIVHERVHRDTAGAAELSTHVRSHYLISLLTSSPCLPLLPSHSSPPHLKPWLRIAHTLTERCACLHRYEYNYSYAEAHIHFTRKVERHIYIPPLSLSLSRIIAFPLTNSPNRCPCSACDAAVHA